MIDLVLITVFLLQGATSPPKWDCAENCEPPNKDVTRLKGREMNERVVSCETPKLPNLLDAKGAVLVEVFINETGNVSCLRAVSGMSLLQGPALEAAKKWKFKPLVVNGKPETYIGFIYVYVSWEVQEMEKDCPKQ